MTSNAPVITRSVKVKPKQPWNNNTIKAEKLKLRKLETKWRKSKSSVGHIQFKFQRNLVSKLIAKSKKEYISELVLEKQSDQKSLFKMVKELTHTNKKQVFPEHVNKKQLANDFSNFFVDKIDKIRSNFNDTGDFSQYDRVNTSTSITDFNKITEDEVLKVISKSTSKTSQMDPIPTDLMKKCLPVLLPCLTSIVNTSLQTGVMPESLKEAIITPILKKEGAEPIYKNFRPISNLPYISKLIEKVICNQVSNYVTLNDLDELYQSAYKPLHSTESAVLKVTNDILMHMDKGEVVFMTLLDLSAAFDTVDHDILLKRLETIYGIKGTSLHWFRSYLSDRKQTVSVGGELSIPNSPKYSVPQGALMGPDLYFKILNHWLKF